MGCGFCEGVYLVVSSRADELLSVLRDVSYYTVALRGRTWLILWELFTIRTKNSCGKCRYEREDHDTPTLYERSRD
jgi:hypothetical protein